MEDNRDESLVSVWKLLNNTTVTLFKNLDNAQEGLRTLMTSIIHSKRDLYQVFVPYPADDDTSEKYLAFNQWLLCHLMYIISTKSLIGIHPLSVKAQIKILNMLFQNDVTFFIKIYHQYVSIFEKLVLFHNSNNSNESCILKLEASTTDIYIENLDLTTLTIEVTERECCERIIHGLMDIFCEMSIVTKNCQPHESKDKIFDLVLVVLETFDFDSKFSAMNFFSKIMSHCGLYQYSEYMIKFLLLTNTLIVNAFITYKDNLLNKQLHSLTLSIILLLDAIIYLGFSLNEKCNIVILDICKTILENYDHNSEAVKKCFEILNTFSLSTHILKNTFKDCTLSNCSNTSFDLNIDIDYSKSTTVNAYGMSKSLQTIVDSIITILQNISRYDMDFSQVKQELNGCKNYLNQIHNYRIKLYSMYQSQKQFYEKIFTDNKTATREIAESKVAFELIPRNKMSVIIFHAVEIIKNKKYTNDRYADVTLCIKDILMLASLTTQMTLEDTMKLLQAESYNFEAKMKPYNNDMYIYSLKILLFQSICMDNIIYQIEWNKKIIELLECCNLNNDHVYNKILQCVTMIVLNNTMPPYETIKRFFEPIPNMNDNELSVTLINILPDFICALFGHYIVIQSLNKSNEDFNLSSICGMKLKLICIHCHKHNEAFILEESVILTKKSQLVYCDMKNVLCNLKAYIENIPNSRFVNFIPASLLSRLIITFAKHSLIFPMDLYKYWFSAGLSNVSAHLEPLISSIMNESSEFSDDYKNKVFCLATDTILKAVKESLSSNNLAEQDVCLEAIQNFGCSKSKSVMLPSLKFLVYFLMNPHTSYGFKAALCIKCICESHKTTPNKVYHEYKKDLCKIIAQLLCYNHLIGFKFVSSILKLTRAFGFAGCMEFISKEFQHALPFIIPMIVKQDKLKTIIPEVASLMPCTTSHLILNRFSRIYVHIYLYESDETASKCYAYLEEITENTLSNMISINSRVILTELLLQYGCKTERVIKACKWLATLDTACGVQETSVPLTKVVDFIQPRFLAVLANFDSRLVNAKVALSVKRKALESFPYLLDLMGSKHMTPLKFKILATLRTALSLMNEFPLLNAKAWDAFIRNVDVIALGPLLTVIFISLLSLFDRIPESVNEMFEYLIVRNENLLSGHLADLFFIKDTKINAKLKAVIQKHVVKVMPDNFIEKTKWYLKYLKSDTAELKMYTLRHLYHLIKDHRVDIDTIIFDHKEFNATVGDLLDILIAGCKDKDKSLAKWNGRCLGQLGAVQPSLLPQKPVKVDDITMFAFSLKDIQFAKAALMELIRAFQFEKYTKDMDYNSLAIQEILSFYNISPNGENKDVWNSFPENMQQIMHPLLSSRYTLAFPTNPTKIHPVFDHATTLNEWAFNWVEQLIPKTEKDSTQDLLRLVHLSLKKDLRTLLLFLPYIILHSIFSNDDYREIIEEIIAVIGLEAFDCKSKMKLNEKKIMRSSNLNWIMTPVASEDGMHVKCCKVIYNLLDFLNRWHREWCHTKKKSIKDEMYIKVKTFLSKFCDLTIARGNVLCGELERALLYLETHMRKSSNHFQEQLGFLAEIYAMLNEPDAIAGIMSVKQSEPTLSELILAHEVTGQLQDAATCYEKYAQQGHMEKEKLQGMVQVYLDLDQPFTALQLLQGANDIFPNDEGLAAEPFWRLAMFDDLEKLLKQSDMSNDNRWGVSIGHCMLALRNRNRDVFREKLNHAQYSVLQSLERAISYTSVEESLYSRSYSISLDLHMIAEIDQIEDAIYKIKLINDMDNNCTSIVNDLIENWNLRLKLLQSSVKTIEPVLRLRRILLEQSKELLLNTHPQTAANLDQYIGKLWLRSAKLARKASIFQQAYIYILNGEKYYPKELFIEKAKLYWMRGQQEPAFCTLKRGLEEHFSNISSLSAPDKKLCAKAKLLIARYNDETTNVDMDVNITHYKEAVEVYRQWEKSLVHLGGYYEKVFAALGNDEKRSSAGGSTRAHALNCYGRALQYGHSRLYQSMPRMLSIWLDFEVPSNEYKTVAMATLSQICTMIETFSERLPLYLFLTAFSQIISRICHPIKEVYYQLKSIIIKLIRAYPQHSLWMMMCVIKSSYPQRIKRCQEILNDSRLSDAPMQKFIHDFNMLAEKLIELCNKPVPAESTGVAYVSALVRSLPRLLASDDFSQIIMPHEKFIKVTLPFKKTENEFSYNPFPTLVYIKGIEDQVTILPSLQRPRKVTLKGSDGKNYIIMLKPKDDLRKDFRVMEFNAVVNRYLQESAEARERRLYIRTYTVLPLNEECGLIEWIPNLLGLRPILLQIYKDMGIHVTSKELKQIMCSKKDSLSHKQSVFEGQLLKKHPPVFSEWFLYTFPDPHSWYRARSGYIRTTAVMSMVGYILGLGDRHGENILFDSTNGDAVHVDFNCLFNKGEEFEWPEKVPFRLTHNMRNAMGPLGHEGMYRKCCETTIRILRAQTTILMSVIRPFVYDPLVTWQRNAARSSDVSERTNQSAKDHLTHIEQRLQGMVRTNGRQFSLSLSPEGQTEHLISEAISNVNLCQMFIGWGPFL